LEQELRAGGDGPVEVERGAAGVVLRMNRGGAEPDVAEPAAPLAELEPGQLALFEGVGEELPEAAPRLHELAVIPSPPLQPVKRLSYSAIALFDRCSYRFYAERVAGMRPAPWERAGDGGSRVALHPTELGDAVHRLLERVDLTAPAPPPRDELTQVVRDWYPAVAGDEIDRIGAFVEAYCGSELARRVSALPGVRPERPFAFDVDGVLVNGRLDVLWHNGARALVLDYKTNALLGRDPAEIVDEEYETQRAVYALACLRAGAKEAEVVYQFLEAPEAVVSATFTAADASRLEGALSASIARIRSGDFRPTPSPFACAGCPALDVVCAGPRLGGSPPGTAAPELAAMG
ncbi:MAG: RecB family exonuclease, partial [Gaiellaceae bacterium]